jgi:benzoyl-CoA reductase/2-hydroxyglutaryl-CoA dehydratase subunit BcrC/BadD/HgdB
LTGSLCESPPERLLELVESVGGLVVDDDLYVGSRYFLNLVPDAANPLEALADAYLNMVCPCPTRIYPRLALGDYLVEKAARAGAKGIVVLIVKYCEAHNYTYPHMRRRFEAAGIPHLKIETEHETVALEQAKTRLQAFVEMIKD